jgi:hypothetical protein
MGMTESKKAWCAPGKILRLVAVAAFAAASLVWIDTGGHVDAADLVVSTPYPSVVASPAPTNLIIDVAGYIN